MVVREDELMRGWRRWMAVQDKMGVGRGGWRWQEKTSQPVLIKDKHRQK